ncbi:hypothetical protein GR328_08550 [Microvirga makkahensis]|uniref:Uncharacterized protein n=1 Tax=Microvirga makkahensis TaxID=1128670 RepID=A0A7X3MR22_9HYPH|nr:hypothetical protein [Microvirga makkahensis]
MFALVPIIGLLLGISTITVSWDGLVLSIVLYFRCRWLPHRPFATRCWRRKRGTFANLLRVLQPLSLAARLARLMLPFGFQDAQILAQPLVIAMLAVPILIQVCFISGPVHLLIGAGEKHCVAAPSAELGKWR